MGKPAVQGGKREKAKVPMAKCGRNEPTLRTAEGIETIGVFRATREAVANIRRDWMYSERRKKGGRGREREKGREGESEEREER